MATSFLGRLLPDNPILRRRAREPALISKTAEYGLRVMAWLARKAPNPQISKDIAEGTRVPASYLSKVVQALGRAGLIDAKRGRYGGGITLAVSPEEITILEVVQAVDPPQRVKECPLGPGYHGKDLCPLHRRLDDAMESVERALGRSTLAEILAESSPSQPLCRPARTRSRKPAPKKRATSHRR